MLRDVLDLLSGLPEAFADRLRPRLITNPAEVAWFVRTRAAHVAQTSLYGYLKTRMGTSFREYFEDDVFSASIRGASARLFVSCTGDLSIFAVAVAGRDGRLGAAESAALAQYSFAEAIGDGLEDVDAAHVPRDAPQAFAGRALRTDWAAASKGEASFANSTAELLRVSPIVDELKQLDHEIVRNSIRFRWRDVREQLRKRIREDAVCESWRAGRS